MPKQSFKGSNINLVKLHNMQVVLLSLLYESNLSRVQLAQKTNLSNTTITNLIAELINQGIVSEVDEIAPEPGELRPVGRPRTSIRLEPNARYVVGVHIGVGLYRVGVSNVCNEMLHNQLVHFEIDLPVEQALELLANTIESVIVDSGVERSRIIGIGIGASGLIDFQTGTNLLAPNLNWHDVHLRDFIQDRLSLPTVVDNNVRTMAIGETYFGAGRGVDSLVFVYGRTGVGAGLIYKGEVFRGSTKGAGEIGHTIMLPFDGEPCRCGNRGCLETLVSENAILHMAEKIAQADPTGIMAHSTNELQDISPIERVFRAARAGDDRVRDMLEERASYLGIALANLVNLFNPELILLGGIFSRGEDFFLEPVTRTVQQRSFGGMGKRVRIQSTSFGWKAGVLGASALALMYFFFKPEEITL